MKMLKFPYLKYLITPPDKKPAQYIYRPVIPMIVSTDDKTVTFDALVDSGADECTFPAWIAERLGYNVYKGQQKIFSGIGGAVLAYLHKTNLKLNGFEFPANVFFSHEWDDMPFGLLGQAGFFSHFNITFDYREKELILKYRQ